MGDVCKLSGAIKGRRKKKRQEKLNCWKKGDGDGGGYLGQVDGGF